MSLKTKPHQKSAVADAVVELTSQDRATVIMPCGTGKTLVGINAAKELKPKVSVVLAPTLALIRQTMQAWQAEDAVPGARYIAVCSDESVADNTISEDDISPSEIGTLVTTSAVELKKALMEAGDAPVVILSTYSSAPIAGRGLIESNLVADMAVFDEAHRTATGEASLFSQSLQDAVLPARKRLFMTATPRVYPALNDGPTISMDNEALYGRFAHVLPVRDAIAQGLIVDYRVLISVVTTDEIGDATKLNPAEMYQHAAAVALGKAMNEFGLNKGFLFHRTVADAEAFAALPALARETSSRPMHVSGVMPLSERASRMEQFLADDRGLLGNAKCLTEGVDVPSVDLVCFMAPKRSTVDVVQAVGRSMRTSPGKTYGYVLLPILLDIHKGESLDVAIERSEMSELYRVLSELRDMEIPLARSRHTGPVSDAGIAEVMEYFDEKVLTTGSPEVVEAMRKAIKVLSIRDLRTEWDDKYLALKSFKEANGHLKFDPGSEESLRFGKFISNCRQLRLKDLLPQRSIDLLNGMGFPWTAEDASWEKRLVEASTVPRADWNPRTYSWVAEQKRLMVAGEMPAHQLERLNSVGLDFLEGRQDRRRAAAAAAAEPITPTPQTRPGRVQPLSTRAFEARRQARDALSHWMVNCSDKTGHRNRSYGPMDGVKAGLFMMAVDMYQLSCAWRTFACGEALDASQAEKLAASNAYQQMREHWSRIESFLDLLRNAIRIRALEFDELDSLQHHLNMPVSELSRPNTDFMRAASTVTMGEMHDEAVATGACVAKAGATDTPGFARWLLSECLVRLASDIDRAKRVLGDGAWWGPAKLLEELGVELHSKYGHVEWHRRNSINALPTQLQRVVGERAGPPSDEMMGRITQALLQIKEADQASWNAMLAKMDGFASSTSRPLSGHRP